MRAFSMSGRYRTVALQAVGVAVIAAIVFIAFLRPDEPGDLSGIDAPGGEEQPIVNSPPDDKSKKPGDRSNGNNRRGNGQGQSQGSARGDGEQTGNGGDATSDDDAFGGDTPPDDQYDDLVTRLLMQVGEPAIIRQIDPGIEETDARP